MHSLIKNTKGRNWTGIGIKGEYLFLYLYLEENSRLEVNFSVDVDIKNK